MPLKMSIFKILKNKKMCFFLMSQGAHKLKIRFLGQKLWPVAREQTDKRTNRQKVTLKSSKMKIFKKQFFLLFLCHIEPTCQKLGL